MYTTTTGIYARISSDVEGDRLGVQRQIEDCTREAERRDWTVVDTYVDNDVSATRSKVRPVYERLLGDIRSGRLTGLVVWDVDRLTRSPRELEDIIDLADKQGLALASVGGEIDLSTPQGRMTARIKGSVARHEAEQMSRRIKRRIEQKAAAGLPTAPSLTAGNGQTVRTFSTKPRPQSYEKPPGGSWPENPFALSPPT